MKIVWLYCKDRQINRLEQNLVSIDVKATQWGKERLQEIVLEDVSNNAYKKNKTRNSVGSTRCLYGKNRGISILTSYPSQKLI